MANLDFLYLNIRRIYFKTNLKFSKNNLINYFLIKRTLGVFVYREKSKDDRDARSFINLAQEFEGGRLLLSNDDSLKTLL